MIDYHGVLVDPADLSERATYEPEECALALAHFDAADRVLVGGVGMGLVAACIASTGAFVVGVEAQACLAKITRQNVRVNGQGLRVLHGALSLDGGDVTTIGSPAGEDWALARTGIGKERVATLGITGLLHRFRMNAVALDVEGAEVRLTREALRHVEKSLIEVHKFVIGKEGVAMVREMIREAGHLVEQEVARPDHVSYLVTKRALRARRSPMHRLRSARA